MYSTLQGCDPMLFLTRLARAPKVSLTRAGFGQRLSRRLGPRGGVAGDRGRPLRVGAHAKPFHQVPAALGPTGVPTIKWVSDMVHFDTGEGEKYFTDRLFNWRVECP
jgi:hypothetical protein